jgi:hypothetical protein
MVEREFLDPAQARADGTIHQARRLKELPVIWHGLTGAETSPMTEQESHYLVSLTFMEKSFDKGSGQEIPGNAPPEVHEEFMSHFPYAVLYKRLEVFGNVDKFSIPTLALCGLISKSPGDAVMWAYTLNYIYVASGVEQVDLLEFVKWFPWGLPTEDARRKAWDAQKGYTLATQGHKVSGIDNWVDNFANWPRKA